MIHHARRKLVVAMAWLAIAQLLGIAETTFGNPLQEEKNRSPLGDHIL